MKTKKILIIEDDMQIGNLEQEVLERGITFLISSHILDELSRLVTYYGFIDRGRMVKEISAAELEDKCAKK